MTESPRATLSSCVVITACFLVIPFSLAGQQAASQCPLCDPAAQLVERFGLRESDPVRSRSDWAPPVKVVTIFGEQLADVLSTFVPGIEIIGVAGPPDVPAVIEGADVYIGRCTPEIIERGQNLKYIHITAAGAGSCTAIPEVAERDILVTNMQRVQGPQIADHAMALLLSLSRRMAPFAMEQSAGAFPGWSVPTYEMWRLEGKTMLVVGLGGVGTEVAKRADAFGMRVTATRNSSRNGPDFVDYVGLAHEALELAAQADVVVNAAPLTPSTRGMFNAEFFDAMKETAIFINVGRGQSAVTADLVAALQSGNIAAAGLDVMDPEPLPPGHALWSMPNVVLTPHIGGLSDANVLLWGGLAGENLRRYASGEGVVNVVNLRRGY